MEGFHKWCLAASTEEREHAMKLMDYQNKRGGRVVLQSVNKPEKVRFCILFKIIDPDFQDVWGSALEAMEAAMTMEKAVNTALLELHKTAGNNHDGQVRLD